MYDPIIFSAYKSTRTVFSSGAYITGFTKFLTNVGFSNSFTLSDGIFKAPRKGIYEFSASVYHWGDGREKLAVVKNGAEFIQFQDYTIANTNTPPDFTLTFNWFMELEKGDNVRLQVVAGQFICGGEGANNCIFNGKYIRYV